MRSLRIACMPPLFFTAGVTGSQEVVYGLAVAAAFAVQSAIGFGAMICTVAVAALLLPVTTIVAATLPASFTLSVTIALRERTHLDGRVLFRRMLPWMVVGLPVGLVIARSVDNTLMKTVFGIFVALVAAFELIGTLRRRGQHHERALAAAPRAGLLFGGGVVHGMFASGGPMAVYVAAREIADKARFRATLCLLWVLINPVVLAGLIYDGHYGRLEVLSLSAIAFVAGSLGYALGNWMHDRLNPYVFAIAVYALLLAQGGMLASVG